MIHTEHSASAFYRSLHELLSLLEQPEWRGNLTATRSARHFITLLQNLLTGAPAPAGPAKVAAYRDSTAGMEDARFETYRASVRVLLENTAAFIDGLQHFDPARSHFHTVCAEWYE